MRAPYSTFIRQLAAIGCKIPPSPGGILTFFFGVFVFFFLLLFLLDSISEECEVEDARDGEVTDDAQLASLAEEFDRDGEVTEEVGLFALELGAK